MDFQTTIAKGAANTILDALRELGRYDLARTFFDALKWQKRDLASIESILQPINEYDILVTPEVTAALVEVLGGGQLVSFIQGGIGPQTLHFLVLEWQQRLSNPEEGR